jgi:hypothetical protein
MDTQGRVVDKNAETLPAPPAAPELTELESKDVQIIVLQLHILKKQVEDLDRQKLAVVGAMRELQDKLKPYADRFGPGVGVAFSPETMSISNLVKAKVQAPETPHTVK